MAQKPTYERLQQQLHDLEERVSLYKTLVNDSLDLFYRTDIEGLITFISPSVHRLSGYTVDEAIGMRMAEEVYLIPEERNAFLGSLRENGQVTGFEARLKRKDGSVWWASTSARIRQDADGNILGVEGVTRDISEKKSAEVSLRAVEERFRIAFQTSPDAINMNRMSDGVYLDVNEGFISLTGYTREEIVGRTSLEMNLWVDPGDRTRLVDELSKTRYVKNLEAQFVMKDGTVIVGLTSARLLQIDDDEVLLSVTRDISERKRAAGEKAKLEKQLGQAQKLEAIGRLAGGVAHDLNNQLAPILGYCEILLEETPPSDPRREMADQIMTAATGARDLVRQLLAFGRKQTLEYRPLDINEVLSGIEMIFRRTIREDIEVQITRAQLPNLVMADKGQIEQVIMNLVLNAVDAMREGGKLILKTTAASLDQEAAKAPGVLPGDYVVLTVRDTGHGMDEETRSQIFEPFFSTKGDSGTGLGLATVYGIVKQHGGEVQVESGPGSGTTFRVYLPASADLSPEDKTSRISTAMLQGTETVLVVEDNDQVRSLVCRILGRNGYRVLEAGHSAEAIELFESAAERIDLLLTDVVMPGMNGRELRDRLMPDHPSLKVIFMSGYAEEVVAHHGVLDDGVQFIQKPFTSQALLSRIRQVLNRRDG